MKKIVFFIVLLFVGLGSCSEQKENIAKNIVFKKIKPKTDIKVNKEYDDNGNIIRYDSSYTSYYSNIEGDSLLRDSMFEKFKIHIGENFELSKDPFFDDFFFQDSLLQFDFYKKNFFLNRFKENNKEIEKMFSEMDSIKNKFFSEQFKK